MKGISLPINTVIVVITAALVLSFSRTGDDGSIEWISFSDKVHEFHFLGMSFAFLVILQLVIGIIKPRSEPWIQTHSGDVDVTPWKYTPLAAAGLVLFVFLIYAVFADFSVLGG